MPLDTGIALHTLDGCLVLLPEINTYRPSAKCKNCGLKFLKL